MNDVAQAGYKVGPVLATAIALLCLGTRLYFERTAVDDAQNLWIRCVSQPWAAAMTVEGTAIFM